ncbi:hypothetical protein MRX96_001180 [Rhipicephalus microplus]
MYSPASAGTAKIVVTNRSGNVLSSCNETLKLNSSNVQSFCNETLKLHCSSPLSHAASAMFEHLTLTSGLPPRRSTAWLSSAPIEGASRRSAKSMWTLLAQMRASSTTHATNASMPGATTANGVRSKKGADAMVHRWHQETQRTRKAQHQNSSRLMFGNLPRSDTTTVKMAINLLPQQHGGTHYEWLFGHSTPIQARATQHGLACSTPAMPDRLLIPAGSGKH